MNKFAIHFYVVARGGLRAEVGADLAVNSDTVRGNQFIAMTARTDAGGGEETIETQGRLQELQRLHRYKSCDCAHCNLVTFVTNHTCLTRPAWSLEGRQLSGLLSSGRAS